MTAIIRVEDETGRSYGVFTIGPDRNNGWGPQLLNQTSGLVKSIQRALEGGTMGWGEHFMPADSYDVMARVASALSRVLDPKDERFQRVVAELERTVPEFAWRNVLLLFGSVPTVNVSVTYDSHEVLDTPPLT